MQLNDAVQSVAEITRFGHDNPNGVFESISTTLLLHVCLDIYREKVPRVEVVGVHLVNGTETRATQWRMRFIQPMPMPGECEVGGPCQSLGA